jgi:aspartyl aminopeptidase
VDIGVPILAMHATWGLASKADLWSLYQYFLASYAME